MTASHKSARLIGAVALAAGAALTLSACGAGQISQTANQVAALNGVQADQGAISLRNIQLIYGQQAAAATTEAAEGAAEATTVATAAGDQGQLVFSVINTDLANADTLTGIRSDAARTVTIAGSTVTLPPRGEVQAYPAGWYGDLSTSAVMAAGDVEKGSTQVEFSGLNQDVRVGLSIPVTFTFAKAGSVTVQVPVVTHPDNERG